MADEELKRKTSEKESTNLLKHAASSVYHPAEDDKPVKTHAGQHAMQNCIDLFKLDYDIELIDNKGAKLCSHYPSEIVLMIEKGSQHCPVKGEEDRQLSLKEARYLLQPLMEDAAYSRCRSRFVVPTIVFNGQYICRSATVAGGKELIIKLGGQKVYEATESAVMTASEAVERVKDMLVYTSDWFWGVQAPTEEEVEEMAEEEGADEEPLVSQVRLEEAKQKAREEEERRKAAGVESYWTEYNNYCKTKIEKDKELLVRLNVKSIFDLMVEDAKVKYGLIVSSSEKTDEEKRYKDFQLYSFPYPGCEFFSQWKYNRRRNDVHYDWSALLPRIEDWDHTVESHPLHGGIKSPDQQLQSQNTARMNIGGESSILHQMGIDWDKYRGWDLADITGHYMQALVKLIAQGETGVLVHCISGWDRTPLFISLLRLSLWADDLIHKSLEPAEMLYFTLAYDWYLFGHNYPARRKKGEDVLPFCFFFLQVFIDEKFSFQSISKTGGNPKAKKAAQREESEGVRRSSRLASLKAETPTGGSDKSTPRFSPYSTQHPSTSGASPTPSTSKSKSPATAKPPVLRLPSVESTSSPRKRQAYDEGDGECVSPVKKCNAPVWPEYEAKASSSAFDVDFSTIGEQIKQAVERLQTPQKDQTTKGEKENVKDAMNTPEKDTTPEKSEKTLGTKASNTPDSERKSEDLDYEDSPKDPHRDSYRDSFENISGDSSFLEESGYELIKNDSWTNLPLRHKRLLGVSYIFQTVMAVSDGLPVPDCSAMTWRQYVYGSITDYKFDSSAFSSLLHLFSSQTVSEVPAEEEEEKKCNDQFMSLTPAKKNLV